MFAADASMCDEPDRRASPGRADNRDGINAGWPRPNNWQWAALALLRRLREFGLENHICLRDNETGGKPASKGALAALASLVGRGPRAAAGGGRVMAVLGAHDWLHARLA